MIVHKRIVRDFLKDHPEHDLGVRQKDTDDPTFDATALRAFLAWVFVNNLVRVQDEEGVGRMFGNTRRAVGAHAPAEPCEAH